MLSSVPKPILFAGLLAAAGAAAVINELLAARPDDAVVLTEAGRRTRKRPCESRSPSSRTAA